MIRITSKEDLKHIHDEVIKEYIQSLLDMFLQEYVIYCPYSSIEGIGAIILLQNESDIENYQEMGLTEPVSKTSIEWMKELQNGYINVCVVIDNDRALNIIGKRQMFNNIMEDFKNEH